jgi:hypothetical protein
MFVDFFNISKRAQKHYKHRGYGAVKTFFFFSKAWRELALNLIFGLWPNFGFEGL